MIVIFFFILQSCTKEDENPINQTLQSQELAKVETKYQEGQFKYEGPLDEPKIESQASQELIEKIRVELEKTYTKQISLAKSGGNLVAVFKDNTCGSYPELVVNMDCEDSSPASYSSGWIGASQVTPTYKNVIFRFCVVNNQYFEQTDVDYAVLMLTTTLPSGVSRICRYFDNEDNGNGNWTTYDGSPYSGWFGDCYFGTNTRLSFYYYPHTTYHAFPSIGIVGFPIIRSNQN